MSDSCSDVDLGDPDVTGFGVLISFFASFILVLVAMIAAYPLDALPKSCYNDFDDLLLGRKSQRTDGKHTDAFRSFMLSLSDQQLFSGLALGITIQVVHHGLYDLDTEISAYAYCNAVVLAVFSCLIHLASLATLKEYFLEPQRAWLKHARFVLMLSVLALVLQPLEEMYRMLNFLADMSESLRCALQDLPDSSWYTKVGQEGGRQYKQPAFLMGLIVIFGVLGRAYLHRLSELYPMPSPVAAWPHRYSDERLRAAKDRLAAAWSDSRSSPARFFLVFLPEFHGSFVFNIVWLLFFFTIGLMGLVQSLVGQLSNQDDTLSDISIRPNFGQLLPLVLLGLPVMAMGEAYSDTRAAAEAAKQSPCPRDDESKTAVIGTQARPSPFSWLTESKRSTWRRRCVAFTGLYALVTIYVALAMSWAFTALSYQNSTEISNFPNFIRTPDTFIIFIAFLVVVFWSVLCFSGALVRSLQLRRELRGSSDGSASSPGQVSSRCDDLFGDGVMATAGLPASTRRATV